MDQQRSRKQRSDFQGTRIDNFLYDESGLLILAHLERTLMYSLPLDYFAPDVIFHFQGHLQKVISVGQIDEKLQFFWSHWHPLDSKPSEWRKIYSLGLKGLPRLPEKRREWIRERAIRLHSDDQGTPRRLRSTSMLPRTLSSSAKGLARSLAASTSSSSRVRKSQRLYQSPRERRMKTRASILENARGTSRTPTSERAVSASMFGDHSQIHSDDFAQIKNEFFSNNNSGPSEQLRYNNDKSCCSQMKSELNNLRDQNAQIISELGDIKNQNAKLVSELDDSRSQRDEDTRYWERLYRKCQKRRDSLKRRNKHMQAEHGIGQEGVGQMNLKLRSENDLLREKLDSYEATFRFKEPEPFAEAFRIQNVQKVVKHVDFLLMKLDKILQGQDALLSVEKLDDVKGSGISALLERSFGLKSNPADSGESAVTITEICGVKLRSVVLCLISAALCTWVFEADMGALFQENSHLYSKFQSLLAAQDKKLTHSFEFAAHEKCIEDPYFRDVVIPRRARHLARQILDCANPLLDAHRNMNDDYVNLADEWLEADEQLTEIFKQALYAKVRLLLSTDMYECALHIPGKQFDSNSMQNMVEQVGHFTGSEQEGVVNMTIFPGLVRYDSKKEGFNYNRFFVGKSADKGSKGVKAEILRRAIVSTR